MQLIDGRPVYAATDLVGFLACGHLTNLDRAAVAGLTARPEREDPEIELIAKRGLEHERRYLEGLRAQGLRITEIERDGSVADQGDQLRAAAAETETAMRAGAEVIYQATFFDGTWRGHADFLRRVETAHEPNGSSTLGAWSYEVADTKLARHAKAGALLQLCVYNDLLARVQGVLPTWMEVALGGSAGTSERFRVADSMAYYRRVKQRFLEAVAGTPARWPVTATYPEPVEHCGVCKWAPMCDQRRRADDHLSLVAGITTRQRRGLVSRGVATVEALAQLSVPVTPPIEGASPPVLLRIHDQARLQVAGRHAGQVLHEELDPEPQRGLALLPPPSAGDLFFDIEGDPFVEEGGADGLEYLFGVIEPGELDATAGPGTDTEPAFHAFWGTTRAQEKVAFERLIDLFMDRLARDPQLHIYHYGSYEPSHVKTLMGRHATREDEVDALLRGGVFVDLYNVVRQGVRVSTESYSIKKLEPLYDLQREVALKDAGSSIVRFEQWLDGGRQDQSILDLIEAYNRDDCLSTWKLRGWLEERRADEIALGKDVPRPGPREAAAPQAVSAAQARVQALVERLTQGLPADTEAHSEEEHATWLLAQLLDWHRREDKVAWWNYFAMLEMNPDELFDSTDALGGLRYEGPVGVEKQSTIHRYRFEPQETKVGTDGDTVDPATKRPAGSVVAIDAAAGWVDLKRGNGNAAPHPHALVPNNHYGADAQKEALLRLGEWVADNSIDAQGPFRAERDLLLRRAPRCGQLSGQQLAADNETGVEAARRLALQLDHTCLAIQGPPGAGKTFAGAHMIVDLVRAGKRVGITANSHKVISNLLEMVGRLAAEAGVSVDAVQKAKDDQVCPQPFVRAVDDNAAVAAQLAAGTSRIGAGTAWLWSADALHGSVDVLFVDEAGQMSLANVLAVSQAAASVVLLGDPLQLEQPMQGSHPPGAEASGLQHMLGGHPTMPAELGLFLERTWRLHPAVCAFTSEVFYEGRLESERHLAAQSVTAAGRLSGSGLRMVAVSHEGDERSSAAEARVVAALATELIGGTWVDGSGTPRTIDWSNVLIVAPYNAQVAAIAALLPPAARVGTVDRFQGQEGAVAIYSMTTSSADLAPRGMEFLYSLNRLNVATSRARCLAVIVASPHLLDVDCRSPRQMLLANALCRAAEMAQWVDAPSA